MKEFNGLFVGQIVTVARRPGVVTGLRLESAGPVAYVVYDDGFAQWVPIVYVQPKT